VQCAQHRIEINPLARKKVLMFSILFGDINVNIAIFSSLHSENEKVVMSLIQYFILFINGVRIFCVST
jgi:hypothetical protein